MKEKTSAALILVLIELIFTEVKPVRFNILLIITL